MEIRISTPNLNSTEKKIVELLKKIYWRKSSGVILEYEPILPNSSLTPDFLILDPQRGVALIEVKGWSPSYLKKIGKKEVKTEKETLLNPAYKARLYHNWLKNFFRREGLPEEILNTILLLPNFPKEMDKGMFQLFPTKTYYKEDLIKLSLFSFFPEPTPLSPSLFAKLEQVFYPEINLVVYREKEQWVNRETFNRKRERSNLKGKITSHLKSVEMFKNRTDLNNTLGSDSSSPVPPTGFSTNIPNNGNPSEKLSTDFPNSPTPNFPNPPKFRLLPLDKLQRSFIRRSEYGPYHIAGIPGSGKTAMVLSRALFLKRIRPNWKIVILTYNKTLANRLKVQLREIVNYYSLDWNRFNIDVQTFHSYCLSKLTKMGIPIPPKSEWDDSFWEWLPKQVVALGKKGMLTPDLDAVLIDEYQDFHKVWLEGITYFLKPYFSSTGQIQKNLLLAGDRLQAIYNRFPPPWTEIIGTNLRGRSILLKKSYRNNQKILQMGLNIFSLDEKLLEEAKKFYEGLNLVGVEEQGGVKFISNFWELLKEIERMVEKGTTLIVGNTKEKLEWLYKRLPSYLKKRFTTFKSGKEPSSYYFTTIHSSKGLEYSNVVVLGVDNLLEEMLEVDDKKGKIQSRNSEKGKEPQGEKKEIWQNLKLIYVAITRGRDEVALYIPNPDHRRELETFFSLQNFI